MCLIKFCCHRELFYADLLTRPDAAAAKYFFFLPSPVLMNARSKPQRNPLKHNIYSRRSKCVDLNMEAWFSGFPGERESVTCWRELQSDKRRPHSPPPFSNHWCSPMCDCLNMWLKWCWWRWGSGEAQVLTSARL